MSQHCDAFGLISDEDVPGAPLKIGQPVRVLADQVESETLDRRFVGRTGVVSGLVYDDPARQFPADPLVRVRVEGVGEDLFFLEELGFAAPQPRRRDEWRHAAVAPQPG